MTNSNASPGTVSAIDVATRTVVGTITVGTSPEGIAATPCTAPVAPVTPVAPAPDRAHRGAPLHRVRRRGAPCTIDR